MNFMQQQQMMQAQAMAAQQRGGLTPQQQMAMAGGNPYAAQQMAMAGGNPYAAQQMAAAGGNPYAAQQMAAAGGNPYAAQQAGAGAPPQYAAPVPAAAPAVGGDSTVISVSFPDGCILGYDRLRNELILNGRQSNTRMRQIPARPNKASMFGGAGGSVGAPAVPEAPAEPVEKSGTMTKLGWKKTMLGSDSWQPRFFRLTATHLSYHKDPSSPAINTIPLNKGVIVNITHANSPARKNRYEDMANPGVGGMMTMQMGQMMSQTSGVVGRDNCVEVIFTAQVGTMLDGVMANNAIGLAFGGGMQQMKKDGQGRTYYLSCDSLAEAEEWAAAIKNNVKALPEPEGGIGGAIGGAAGYGNLNNVMNMASNIQNQMANAQDPSKSFEWYRSMLGTQLPPDQLMACLDRFYNELDRNNVPHR